MALIRPSEPNDISCYVRENEIGMKVEHVEVEKAWQEYFFSNATDKQINNTAFAEPKFKSDAARRIWNSAGEGNISKAGRSEQNAEKELNVTMKFHCHPDIHRCM